jgi:hypothetical protein
VIGLQLLPVDLGFEQERGEVVLRIREVLRDAVVEVAVELTLFAVASTSSTIMRMNRRKISASAAGKPSIFTITRTGMCCAYSSAASKVVWPVVVSSNSLQSSRVYGSSAAIGFGANAGNSNRRANAWNGGSDVMGGATPIGAGRSSGPGRKSLTMTCREVKCSVSYATAATPSCVVGIHAPP